MVNNQKLADVGFQYLGTPYEEMDCQDFVETCLRDCGEKINLPGSNAWYRECIKNGFACTPEEATSLIGFIPRGAFLFIVEDVSDTTPEKYRGDGFGDAIHMGIVTGKGKGAIHSSLSKGCVCESEFRGKTIPHGGWNRVGFWRKVDYGVDIDDEPIADDSDIPSEDEDDFGFPDVSGWHPTIRRGSKGDEVILLQTMLYKLGYGLGVDGIDGDYGRNTEKAVKEFQSDHKLVVDGICGPMTWDALDKAVNSLNETPMEHTYTVCIHHLDKTQADAMRRSYPGCVVTEE